MLQGIWSLGKIYPLCPEKYREQSPPSGARSFWLHSQAVGQPQCSESWFLRYKSDRQHTMSPQSSGTHVEASELCWEAPFPRNEVRRQQLGLLPFGREFLSPPVLWKVLISPVFLSNSHTFEALNVGKRWIITKLFFWPPPLIFFILYFNYNVIFIILGFSLF